MCKLNSVRCARYIFVLRMNTLHGGGGYYKWNDLSIMENSTLSLGAGESDTGDGKHNNITLPISLQRETFSLKKTFKIKYTSTKWKAKCYNGRSHCYNFLCFFAVHLSHKETTFIIRCFVLHGMISFFASTKICINAHFHTPKIFIKSTLFLLVLFFV